jgi:nucleotide-binding universal stress UspA family protein
VDVVLGAIYYPDDAAAHYGLDTKSMVDRDPAIEQLVTRDLHRRFGGDGVNVTAHARRGLGRIGDHMVDLAKEQAVDVIVVGTGQKTGLGRLGSVSSVIVNDAPTSVVCVPPQAEIATQTVPILRASVVATDLSAFANRAVAYAFGVVEADVHIIHVAKDDDTIDEADIKSRLLALAPAGAKQRVHAHVIRGDEAATAIAQAAARLGVVVVGIASHGRSGLSRALVGSVADRLLRATRLPVLVLRPS